MEAIIRLDERWGVILVNGEARVVWIGLTIGSPAAAGGSHLAAARREHKRLQIATAFERFVFFKYVFKVRWSDGLAYVFRRHVLLLIGELLNDLASVDFYGSDLRLLAADRSIGFGFKFTTVRDKLQLSNSLPFIADVGKEMMGAWGDRKSTFHGGPQFRTPRVEAGILRGHLIRSTIQAGHETATISDIVCRVAVELCNVGVHPAAVKRATLRVAREHNLFFDRIKATLEFPAPKRKLWGEVFDAFERRDRLTDAALVRLA